MDFHPPRLQSRNQRLNGMRLARHAVPQHKHHHHRQKSKHKPAEFLHGEFLFIIKIHQRGDHQKENKHLIKVGHRHMPRIGAQKIALVPAHQQAGEARQRRHPAKRTRHIEQSIGWHMLPPRRHRTGDIAKQSEKHKRTLPHNRRLAAQKITQQKAFAVIDIAAIKLHRAISQRNAQRHKPAQRLEKPAQQNGGNGAEPQNRLLIAIHMVAHPHLRQHRNQHNGRSKKPIPLIQTA